MLFLLVGPLYAQESPTPRLTADVAQSDFRTLLSQAESGDRKSQYRLALLYEYPEGSSVPKNDAAARGWMLRSAEQGYAPAQAMLGEMYLGAAGDRGKAERWLQRAAEQGNTEGQFWLGATYENGKFGRTDYQEAFQWLRKAAGRGNPDGRGQFGGDVTRRRVRFSELRAGCQVVSKGGRTFPRHGRSRTRPQSTGNAIRGRFRSSQESCFRLHLVFTDSVSNNLKEVEGEMTRAQIAQARQLTVDWLDAHPPEHDTVAQQGRR
jgi:TPR repeat protein